MGESPDAFPQHDDIEVEQEAKLAVSEFKIREHLRIMDSRQFVYRLQLNHHKAVNQKVEAKATIDSLAFVKHGHFFLTFERQVTQGELVRKTLLIGQFEKARPQFTMHVNCRTNDLV